ncbi:hybrid sensor histidine kinase/response regulator [Roseovarius ramblicola]|uniref:histidine kinase n=1 Tax=Roseovarius ramblicola TaxID=2022336 RepID=A0ABV5I528_9RHOB
MILVAGDLPIEITAGWPLTSRPGRGSALRAAPDPETLYRELDRHHPSFIFCLPERSSLRVEVILDIRDRLAPDVPVIFASVAEAEAVARANESSVTSTDPAAPPHCAVHSLSSASAALRAARQATAKPHHRDARLNSFLDHVPMAVLTIDPERRIRLFNKGAEKIFGYEETEVLGQDMNMLIPEGKRARHDAHVARFKRSAEDMRFMGERSGVTALRKDGTVFHAEAAVSKVLLGAKPHFSVFLTDATRQWEADAARRRSEAALARAQRVAQIGSWEFDPGRGALEWSEEMVRIHGVPGDPEAPDIEDFLRNVHAEDRDRFRRLVDGALHRAEPFQTEIRMQPEGAAAEVVDARADIQADEHGDGREHIVGTSQVITARKEAEARFRAEQETLRLVTELTTDNIWEWDIQDDAWQLEKGRSAGPDQDRPGAALDFDAVMAMIHPEDRESVETGLRLAVQGDVENWQAEYRSVGRDGSIREFENRATIIRNASGKAERLVGGLSDVTEFRRLDRQFHEAQKLDTIGQLTGGLAHDFNNLLTIILGSADLLMQSLTDGRERDQLASVIDAAERAASLTDGLLAYSRRQPLEPETVDLNLLLESSFQLLRRGIEEGIRIDYHLKASPSVVSLDRDRLQSSLLNLAINASHAIGERGQITIETSNAVLDAAYAQRHTEVVPGSYVVLSVSDNGCGMSPDVLAQAFDPFFTMKGSGVGTGLGLSSVYGFVKQSGGHAKIYSEVGHGTTVKLYLPGNEGEAADRDVPKPPESVMAQGERVLVVEDDDDLRRHVVAQMERMGYTVIAAADARAALDTLEARDDIALLFTDVVMPGEMNGAELARHVQTHWPDVKILFTSGYTENAIIHDGRLDKGVNLISKPYRFIDLAVRLRKVLESA